MFLSRLDYSFTNSLWWPRYLLSGLKCLSEDCRKNILIVTNHFPNPLLYSFLRLALLVSSHIICACRVIPMTLFLDPTLHTVVIDVHAVSVGPSVSSTVMDVFTSHPLGVCLPLSFYRHSGPPVVCLVFLFEFLGQGGNGCGKVSNIFSFSHHDISVGRSFYC